MLQRSHITHFRRHPLMLTHITNRLNTGAQTPARRHLPRNSHRFSNSSNALPNTSHPSLVFQHFTIFLRTNNIPPRPRICKNDGIRDAAPIRTCRTLSHFPIWSLAYQTAVYNLNWTFTKYLATHTHHRTSPTLTTINRTSPEHRALHANWDSILIDTLLFPAMWDKKNTTQGLISLATLGKQPGPCNEFVGRGLALCVLLW